MKIIKDNNITSDFDLIEIKAAKYMGSYVIKIDFSDGTAKAVNFKPFLSKSLHPSISKYLNEDLFVQFDIREGNLNWKDFDLIFPLSDLYEGNIS